MLALWGVELTIIIQEKRIWLLNFFERPHLNFENEFYYLAFLLALNGYLL
jgi:hypothetical protein